MGRNIYKHKCDDGTMRYDSNPVAPAGCKSTAYVPNCAGKLCKLESQAANAERMARAKRDFEERRQQTANEQLEERRAACEAEMQSRKPGLEQLKQAAADAKEEWSAAWDAASEANLEFERSLVEYLQDAKNMDHLADALTTTFAVGGMVAGVLPAGWIPWVAYATWVGGIATDKIVRPATDGNPLIASEGDVIGAGVGNGGYAAGLASLGITIERVVAPPWVQKLLDYSAMGITELGTAGEIIGIPYDDKVALLETLRGAEGDFGDVLPSLEKSVGADEARDAAKRKWDEAEQASSRARMGSAAEYGTCVNRKG